LFSWKCRSHIRTSFTAFYLSYPGAPYSDYQYTYVRRFRAPPGIDYRYFFVNYTIGNSEEPPSLAPPQKYRDYLLLPRNNLSVIFHDQYVKFFFIMDYILENTTSRWAWRGVDDCFLNFPKLWPFLDFLETRYDPLKDFVFLGHCLNVWTNTFLQGGSGWLLSRFAAARLAPFAESAMRSMKRYDDLEVADLLPKVGYHPVNGTCSVFSGHAFKRQLAYLGDGNVGKLPRCPQDIAAFTGRCPAVLGRARDIIFYHEWPKQPIRLTAKRARITFKISPEVHFYNHRGRAWLCRAPADYLLNVMYPLS
jgi:hypothetical protein